MWNDNFVTKTFVSILYSPHSLSFVWKYSRYCRQPQLLYEPHKILFNGKIIFVHTPAGDQPIQNKNIRKINKQKWCNILFTRFYTASAVYVNYEHTFLTELSVFSMEHHDVLCVLPPQYIFHIFSGSRSLSTPYSFGHKQNFKLNGFIHFGWHLYCYLDFNIIIFIQHYCMLNIIKLRMFLYCVCIGTLELIVWCGREINIFKAYYGNFCVG